MIPEFKIFSDTEKEKSHQESLRILWEVGARYLSDKALKAKFEELMQHADEHL